ncbi:MAG TPA: hypothetical protein VNT32_07760 [Thermoleophilaceae bacterium]|nr:hypothetical protein [Thermoleophilaceae bacterium]
MPRRRALALAAAGAAGSALTGALRAHADEKADDERIAGDALSREREAEASYRGLAAGLGAGPERRLLELLAARAGANARVLADALREHGADPGPGGERAARGGAEGGRAALERALARAERLVETHLEAIGRLESGSLATTLASVAADGARHVVVIRAALGREEITEAFGSAPPP